MRSRTAAFVAAPLIALALVAIWFVRRYEIQPLGRQGRANPGKVYDANIQRCTPDDPGRTIVAHLEPSIDIAQPAVFLNQTPLPWSELGNELEDLFKTRQKRVIYVMPNEQVPPRFQAQLLALVRHSIFVDTICVIDPRHPPAWYLPPVYRGGGSGGLRASAR
jgi:hypothetical protein